MFNHIGLINNMHFDFVIKQKWADLSYNNGPISKLFSCLSMISSFLGPGDILKVLETNIRI